MSSYTANARASQFAERKTTFLICSPVTVSRTCACIARLRKCLARYKKILLQTRSVQIYLATTLLAAGTTLAIFQHGQFVPGHALAIMTLAALAVGTLAATVKLFGN
jgi:hypothetical protein